MLLPDFGLIIFLAAGTKGGTARDTDAPSAGLISAVANAETALTEIETSVRKARFQLGHQGITGTTCEADWFVNSRTRLLFKQETTKFLAANGAAASAKVWHVGFDGRTTTELRRTSQRGGAAVARTTPRPTATLDLVASRGLRPHVILLRSIGVSTSLAEYMRAFKTIRPLPNEDAPVVNGMPSLCIELEAADPGVVRLWLTSDGNYIPAKFELYDHGVNRALPIVGAESTQWASVTAGLAVPTRARVTWFDPETVADNDLRAKEIEEIALDRVVVGSAYADAFFATLPTPSSQGDDSNTGAAAARTAHGRKRLAREFLQHWESLSALEKILISNNLLILLYVVRLGWRAVMPRVTERRAR